MDDSERSGDFAKPPVLPKTSLKKKLNLTQAVINRQYGTKNGLISPEFQQAAEDKLVEKLVYDDVSCSLPDFPRSTFLVVFSPDGKKIASTHGNHNVYVTDLTTGKHIQTLTGHPRTPWCIAFHPSSNEILASGCLGGQVRVWDLSGGSELWVAQSQTVIASLAFHPIERMLVIATYNELHFWDWSQPQPFAKCSTKTDREKVRYVTFDRLGNKLLTGIANPMPIQSQWDRLNFYNLPPTTTTYGTVSSTTPTTTAPTSASTSERERSFAFCYRNLMNQYNQLVRRYFDLSRSRVTSTTDRGTDPMDQVDVPSTSGTQVPGRQASSSSRSQSINPTPGPSSSWRTAEMSRLATIIAARPTASDNDSTGSDSGSEAHNSSGNPSSVGTNPFVRPDSTTPTYSSTRGIASSRIATSEGPSQDSTPYTADLLRALLRDVAGSESQSSEDTELEMASRSESPRPVVSRADSYHPRPVPTVPSFQLRPRLLQDPSYQLYRSNRLSERLSRIPIGRRIVVRPGGQFVLSRHSNSPFRPRVPLRVESPSISRPRNPTSAPPIPSQASSFMPARRLLYDQVRVYLCDRILSATEPSSSDTTTNYSHLAREPDADPGPEISWDSESETLIIRPQSGTPRSTRSVTETAGAVTESHLGTAIAQILSTSPTRAPLSSESLSRRIDELEMLTRTRNEVIAMTTPNPNPSQSSQEPVANPAPVSFSSTTTATDTSSSNDRSFESHLRVQVRGLRDIIERLRGDIERVMQGRDVSNMLQNASLSDTPPRLPSSHVDHHSLMPHYQRLAATLARDMVTRRENWAPVPGPSSAFDNSYFTDSFQRRLRTILKVIVLRAALKKLYGAPSVDLIYPGSSRENVQQATSPQRSTSSTVGLASLSRQPNLSEPPPRPQSQPQPSTSSARESPHPPPPPLPLPPRRFLFRRSRQLNQQRLNFLLSQNLPSDQRRQIYVRYNIRYRRHRGRDRIMARFRRILNSSIMNTDNTSNSSSDNASNSQRQTQSNTRTLEGSSSGSSNSNSCKSCGLKTSGSSLKRKGSIPQRFRYCKMQRESSRPSSSRPSSSNEPSTSAASTSSSNASSTRNSDMLQDLIDRVQNLVRIQREVQLSGTSNVVTDEEHSLMHDIAREINRLRLPVRLHGSPQLLGTFRRNVAQLRAHQLLSNMVQSVATFFEVNARNVMDREILKLYNLLKLVMELTDILLEQLEMRNQQDNNDTNTPSTSQENADSTGTSTRSENSNTLTSGHQPEDIHYGLLGSIRYPDSRPPSTVTANGNSTSVLASPTTQANLNTVGNRTPSRIHYTSSDMDNIAITRSSQVPEMPNSDSNSNRNRSSSIDTSVPMFQNVHRSWGSNSVFYPLQNDYFRFTRPAQNSSNVGLELAHIYNFPGFNRSSSFTTLSTNISSGTTTIPITPTDAPAITTDTTSATVAAPTTSATAVAPTTTSATAVAPTTTSATAVDPTTTSATAAAATTNRPTSRSPRSPVGSSNNTISQRPCTYFRSQRPPHPGSCSLACILRPEGPFLPGPIQADIEAQRARRRAALQRGRRSRMISVARVPGPHRYSCMNRQRQVRFNGSVRTRFFARLNSDQSGFSNSSIGSSAGTTNSTTTSTPRLESAFLAAFNAQTRGTRPPSSHFPSLNLPHIRVNDVPADEANNFDSPRSPATPAAQLNEEMSRWRYYRPRFLHPRYMGPNPFEDQDAESVDETWFPLIDGERPQVYAVDPIVFAEAPLSPHHRIQAWDFSHHTIPNIADREVNGVVAECKIHNDASVDVSLDGRLLVTLLPSGRLSVTTMLGVYSLEWNTLGQLLYKTGFDQNAVSVSLSPTARHLLVGLASRALALRDRERTNMAHIFRLGGGQTTPAGSWHSGRGVLELVREVEQTRDMTVTSLNCIRWAPGPGHGFVYGTNTGKLNILR